MSEIELLKEAAGFLHELFNAEILLPAEQEAETDPELQIEGVPFDVSADKAEQIATDLDKLVVRMRHGYDAMHPLVRCPDCAEEYTYCDAGNHYCPSCGENGEGSPEVQLEEA